MNNQTLLNKAYGDKQYKGKHIVIAGGKIFASKTAKKAGDILDEVIKKFPKDTPNITYIPQADTLIFISNV